MRITALAIQRASSIRTKALTHLFHTPAHNGRPAVRCQATRKNEIKLEDPINLFIWRTRAPYTSTRAKPEQGFQWVGLAKRRNRTWVAQVSMRGKHRCRELCILEIRCRHRVRKGSTMFRPTIVIWLVLLVLALTVVAFVSRLVEKYRPANRFSRVREEPSLSPKATHPTLKQQKSRPIHL